MIHFDQPYWLLAGFICGIAVLFFQRSMERRRQAQLARFAGGPLLGRLTANISSRRRLLKRVLWLAALFCCFLVLARPQYGFQMVEVKRKGIDILFALDTSKSMLSEDIRPNRLERSKLAIMDFVHQLEGDRVGLLPFAGTAFLMCPLTIDYSAFENTLTAVNTSVIPRGGTNLAAAIDLAASSLTGDNNHKILILLTDGENLEGDAKGAATKAAQNGMTIFTVGVGTPEGELIPQPGKGVGHFVKDETGKFVTAKLDEATLTTIASTANGLYAPLGKNGEGLEQIYQEKLRLIPKQELMEKEHRQPLERFSWPLGAAFLLLAVEFMISGRKPAQALHSSLIKTAGRRIRQGINKKTVLLGMLISLIGHGQARASKGEEAFAAGDYLGAAQIYDQALKKNPDDPRLHYNAGAAAYKNNLYDQAIASFQQALQSDDLGLQEQTYYNLGNALYQKGEELAQSDPEQAKKIWQQAVDAYNGSLHLNPAANDSKENRKLVSRRLEELNKQQEQQQQSQNDQQQQEQNHDQNQDQKQDEKQGQQQEQNGEPQNQQGQQDDSGGQQDKKDSSPKPDESSGAEQSPDDHQGEAKEPAEDQSGDEAPQAGQPQAGQGAESGKEDQPSPDATPSQAARQTQAGKMSEEEARQLLSRLKEEEGKLNFVPQAGQGKAEKEGTWKDW